MKFRVEVICMNDECAEQRRDVTEMERHAFSGKQIYSFIHQHNIKTIFYMGEAVNMCVLDRTFGIKAMTNWGIHCVLLRDLTDSMYNPKDPPYVSHDKGTELEIKHIERFWCPTALSTNLMKSLTNVRPNLRGR